MFIKEYLLEPITRDTIDEALSYIPEHGEPFNLAGWEYILDHHKGYLPLLISAVPEGTIVPTGNIMASVINTDPNCFWLTNPIETALLRSIWYPTTVATNSLEIKKVILKALALTGTPEDIQFKLHDFGARGVSSLESAGIGGLAHLVNFMGTDTVEALRYGREYYNCHMAGYSVPAMEHSTVTSWGRDREEDSYRNMVKQNGKPGGIVSAVSDSYDIYKACEMWGTVLKKDVEESGATLVVRPDSGVPHVVVLKCLQILEKYFGSITNDKGYKVLNGVRVLQGDGVNIDSIKEILSVAIRQGYSADNLVFGQGGALLQMVNRDDQKFAMKCSAAEIHEEWIDVYKDPITDSGKRSKRGELALIKNYNGEFETIRKSKMPASSEDILRPIFYNGELFNETSLDEVRANANT